MSKKKARRQKRPPAPQHQERNKWRKRALTTIGLMLCLTLTGGILSQWNSLKVTTTPAAPVSPPLAAPEPQSSPTANTLSKEYIYAGGKLVATEEPAPPNAATFVSQSLARFMLADRHYRVVVKMKNIGSNTWPTSGSYQLGLPNTGDQIWGISLFSVSQSTAQNAEATFAFDVTTPQTAGTYNFRNWRMVQHGTPSGDQWFGSSSPSFQVTVSTIFQIAPFDFDADGKVDITVYRPSEGNFYVLRSSDGTVRLQYLGTSGDQAVPGDYDGDRQTDFAVWNPTSHQWRVISSLSGQTVVQPDWGNGSLGDIAVPRDYNGDGKTDLAVFRPSEGNWYIIQSAANQPIGSGTIRIENWGQSGDIPLPGYYDNDGKADVAVFRPTEGNFYIRKSTDNSQTLQGWGTSEDKPVQADYDGDGLTDVAVFRPSEGNWYIRNSSDNSVTMQGWGVGTDTLVPGDYDGDGRADIAVWRPGEGNWYIRNSSDGTVTVRNWGANGDVPVPSAFFH
jgi:hypothetical protein